MIHNEYIADHNLLLTYKRSFPSIYPLATMQYPVIIEYRACGASEVKRRSSAMISVEISAETDQRSSSPRCG